jgi:hypothetical protein
MGMEEEFDPYLHWLAIRDPKRPPNHYRMLGIDPFESDPEVILNAADRQMTHVRRFQGGKHSAESQRLLNELAAAKICLLNPEKKAVYDTALRAEAQPDPRKAMPPPLIYSRPAFSPPPLIDLSLPSFPPSLSGFSDTPPAVEEFREMAAEVSIPSMPLPLTKLQGKRAEPPPLPTDFEADPSSTPFSKLKKCFQRICARCKFWRS